MTEKEAIEQLKSYINAIDTFGTIDPKCCNNLYKPVKTVLQLIEKYKYLYEKSLDDTVKLSKEIATLKRDFEIIDHECSRLEQEDIRKDMIINKMVEQMVGLTIFDIEKEEPLILGNEIEVREYFENKIKEIPEEN